MTFNEREASDGSVRLRRMSMTSSSGSMWPSERDSNPGARSSSVARCVALTVGSSRRLSAGNERPMRTSAGQRKMFRLVREGGKTSAWGAGLKSTIETLVRLLS